MDDLMPPIGPNTHHRQEGTLFTSNPLAFMLTPIRPRLTRRIQDLHPNPVHDQNGGCLSEPRLPPTFHLTLRS